MHSIYFVLWNTNRSSVENTPYVMRIDSRHELFAEVLEVSKLLNSSFENMVCLKHGNAGWYVALEPIFESASGTSKEIPQESPIYARFTRCGELLRSDESGSNSLNCIEAKIYTSKNFIVQSKSCFKSISIKNSNVKLLTEASQINGKSYLGVNRG